MNVISIKTAINHSSGGVFDSVQYTITAQEGISYAHVATAKEFTAIGRERIRDALERDPIIKYALGIAVQTLLQNPQDEELIEALLKYVTSYSALPSATLRKKFTRAEIIRVLNETK